MTSIDVPGAPINDDEDCEEFYPATITPARHHRMLCKLLQALADGKFRRAMIFLPPGSAKSTYASVCFPVWFMGRRKRSQIITLSYGGDLARRFGRRCRSIVKSGRYFEIFEKSLTADVTAADEWNLDDGSTYMTNGLIAGVTGNRADGLIIDDPVRGIRDADSPAFQKSTYEAYINDARTRVKGEGWQLLIQTRWAMGDLGGQLLPENYDGRTGFVRCRDGHEWYVLNVPYMAERADDPLGRPPGELLWTEAGSILNPDDILPIRDSLDPVQQRTWSSLYQQRPSLDEGLYFKREWFKPYNVLPDNLRFYMTSDFALTAKGGDYTVHGVWGVDTAFNLYLAHVYREQVTSDVSVDAALDLVKRYDPLIWAAERDQILNSLGPFIRRRMDERGDYVGIEEMPLGKQGDKAMRARGFQGRAAMGKVFVPASAPWVSNYLRELMQFPAGVNDDQVDMSGVMGRLLDQIVGKTTPVPEVPNNLKDYGTPIDHGVPDADNWKLM